MNLRDFIHLLSSGCSRIMREKNFLCVPACSPRDDGEAQRESDANTTPLSEREDESNRQD